MSTYATAADPYVRLRGVPGAGRFAEHTHSDLNLPTLGATLSPAEEREVQWMAKLEALAAYLAQHNEWPQASGETRPLILWLNAQRKQDKKGALKPHREALLDERLPDWRISRAGSWEDSLKDVAEYRAKYGAWPAAAGESMRLNRWVRKQRHRQKEGSMAADQIKILDAQLPGWRERQPGGVGVAGFSVDDRWYAWLERVAAFCENEGRLPSTSSQGEELSNSNWIRRQRVDDQAGKLSPGQISQLDDRIPGWRDENRTGSVSIIPIPEPAELPDLRVENRFGTFQDQVAKIAAFKMEYGRLPTLNPVYPEVHKMATFIYRLRAKKQDKSLDPAQQAVLDDLFPGWDNPRQTRWNEALDEVARFKEKYGVLPGDSKRSDRERALQVWVKRQAAKAAEGKLTHEQIVGLDAVDGDWRTNKNTLPWENNFAAAVLEYQSQGRIPAAEEGAGLWLAGQRKRAREGDLRSDQIKALDDAIPGWNASPRDIQWESRFAEVRKFLLGNSRLPGKKGSPEEYSLYTWMRTQKSRIIKGTMEPDRITALDTALPGWR